MTVSEFLSGAMVAEDLGQYIASHVKDVYVPYTMKVKLCENILDASCYVTLPGVDKKVFKINSPARFMLFMITLIQNYTDIEFGENVVEDFEKLDRESVVEVIAALVPDSEYRTMEDLLNMMLNDKRENERSLVNIFENSRDAIEIAITSVMDMLKYIETDVEQDDDTTTI